MSVRFAELLGGVSLFADLADGFPPEKVLRTCVLAADLARREGLSSEVTRDAFYATLLRYVGCVGFSHEEAHVYGAGDDITTRNVMSMADVSDPVGTVSAIVRRVGGGAPLGARARAVAALLSDKEAIKRHAHTQCETSIWFARLVGMSEGVVSALAATCERWDGRGAPSGRAEEELPIASRVAHIADVAEIALHRGGREAAKAEVRRRAGKHFDPRLARRFDREADEMLAVLESGSAWEAFLAAEPAPHRCIGPAELDEVARALAHISDLKSVYFATHSTRVAELADGAAARAGLSETERTDLRRAGLVHDLGRAGVPNAIWDKPGRLSLAEWERVRMHAYYTDRILARAAPLAGAHALAAAAHERLDASGYHRAVPASLQGHAARILAAADVFAAMTEPRAHRPALERTEATSELRAEARAGRLDAHAVDAVLAAAEGRPPTQTRREWPCGLTDREVEVLRLLARGKQNREVAHLLGISPRTVQNHIANLYDKLGLYSRAGATLFAVEYHLLD